MSSIGQGFDQVPAIMAEAFLGQETEDSHLRDYDSGINSNPQAVEVWTLQVTSDPGDDVSGVLTFTFGGVTCTLNIDTSTGLDINGIASRIADLANQEPTVRGRVTATVSTDTVTFTGNRPSEPFVLTHGEAFLGAAAQTQAAADADEVPVARAVIRTGFNTAYQPARTVPDHLVALASTAAFTAQVQTLTVDTGAAGDQYVTIYEMHGDGSRTKLGSSPYAGSATAATEATNLAAAINAAAPAPSVDAVPSGSDVTVTAEVAGLQFEVEVTALGTSTAATTGPSPSTSLNMAFAGVSAYNLNEEATAIGGTYAPYKANEGVRYLKRGSIMVESSETLNGGERVYVDLTPGATAGRLYAAPGTNRIALDRRVAKWIRRSHDGLDFGVLGLDFNGA